MMGRENRGEEANSGRGVRHPDSSTSPVVGL